MTPQRILYALAWWLVILGYWLRQTAKHRPITAPTGPWRRQGAWLFIDEEVPDAARLVAVKALQIYQARHTYGTWVDYVRLDELRAALGTTTDTARNVAFGAGVEDTDYRKFYLDDDAEAVGDDHA